MYLAFSLKKFLMPLTTVLFKFFYKNNIDWSDHICEWKQEKVLGNISLYIKEKMNGPKIGHTKTPVTLNTHTKDN